MMEDQIHLIIDEQLPWRRQRFELQVQTRLRVGSEESLEQSEHFGKWRQVANDDAQLAFLASSYVLGERL